MSFKSKVLLVLSALVLVLNVYADVKTGGEKSSAASITVSGGVDTGVWGWSKEVTRVIGIGNPDPKDADILFWGRAYLNLEANIADNVKAKVQLTNRNFNFIIPDPANEESGLLAYNNTFFGDDNTLNVSFDEAYVSAHEFLSEYFSFSLGFQNLAYSLRGDGNYFLLNLKRSNTAFVTSPQLISGEPTPRGWAFAPGGLKLIFGKNDSPWKLDLFYFVQSFDSSGKGIGNFGDRTDENVAGAVFDYNFGEKNLVTLGVVGFGSAQWSSNVWAFGGGVDYFWKVGGGELELYGEGYFETGDFTATIDQKSTFGGFVGGRFTFAGNLSPYIDLSFWYLTGDNGSVATKNEDFVSHRYLGNSSLLLENNFYGFDVKSNYWAIKAEAGLKANLRREKDFSASVLYGFFKVVEEATGAPDDLGSELDVRLGWDYNDSLSFALAGGFLFGSDVLDVVPGLAAGDVGDTANIILFETRLKF